MIAMLVSLVFITVKTIAPDYGFDLAVDGVESEVEVLFDDIGVPHIYAQSETDAMHALGYVHAMERLWQMDLLRRAGAGELSALLGPDMVENDKYLRTLGMREAATRTVDQMDAQANPHILDAMTAYLDSVGIERGDRIAVLAHNGVEFFDVQFACQRNGAICVLLNWRLTVSELEYILNDSSPKVLFHDVEFAAAATELQQLCSIDTIVEI
ncbi:MAG: penicillin acylase family protein, partial [Flavobacteriales bacterium]